MRRVVVALAVLALTGSCTTASTVETTPTSTTALTSTTTPEATSITGVSTTTTSSRPRLLGGELIKLDLESLRPVPGLDPIPVSMNSSHIVSDDGEWIVIFDWADVTPIDVTSWKPTGTFQVPWHAARVIRGDTLYLYNNVTGRVHAVDLETGESTMVGEWPPELGIWDELHIVGRGRIAALGEMVEEGETDFSVFVLDPVSGETMEISIDPIQRIDRETGIFDGEWQIPETDTPGLVWDEDRLLIAHADGPDVTAIDLDTGEVEVHSFADTSWWDRLVANWIPPASAKGPELGTYTSAALSADGRFLLISGSRYDVSFADDGSLVEESEHLGLTVVDTESWGVVDQSDLPFQFVRNLDETILGGNTRWISTWVDDIYVISIDEAGAISYRGPVTVEGGCQAAFQGMLACSEYVGSTQQLRLIDLETLETLEGPTIGDEDWLNDRGVLVDWRPFGASTEG